MFKVDIRGRAEKLQLKKQDALLPLFEAIVNSFQAIEELETKEDSYITISIKRDLSQGVLDEKDKTGDLFPIHGFIVEDSGVGFNSKNYESFLTSDSTYKLSRGGKGIGRLLWLKAFDDINICSIYNEGNINKKRSFKFGFEIDSESTNLDESLEKRHTVIELNGFKYEYKEKCIRDIKTIGFKIIEHCLSYFLDKNCPKVVLKDEFDIINLNELFSCNIAANICKESFDVNGHSFFVTHVKLYESSDVKHRVHYCANNREVKRDNLKIKELSGKIIDNDKSFIYSAYISGEVLDKTVNDERNDFYFNDSEDSLLDDNISLKSLEQSVIRIIREYLKEYIEPIKEQKKNRIIDYVYKEKPMYRTIIKYKADRLDDISPNIKDSDLDIELFKLKQELEYETKLQGQEFINSNKIKDVANLDEYKQRYREYLMKENELGKATLAEYIVHRKVVLDLLENALNNDDGKYALEEYVHNLIFPMRAVSDDIDYEKHNLWLIDEKLAYHYYLASDIKMKNNDVINVDSDDRPDLLIMDKPFALVNESDKPYNTMTIIEFKRPMRDDYTEDDNPIKQVMKYTRQIRNGEKKDKKGRPIFVSDSAPFYLYIVADLTPKLIEQAEYYGMTKTPDNMGYFWFNNVKGISAYIEIISYEKLLKDSKNRNRVMFDKLFSPKI